MFTSERIEALLEDRRIREQEAAAATSALSQQLEATLARLSRAEENLRTATRDYILGEPMAPLRLQNMLWRAQGSGSFVTVGMDPLLGCPSGLCFSWHICLP